MSQKSKSVSKKWVLGFKALSAWLTLREPRSNFKNRAVLTLDIGHRNVASRAIIAKLEGSNSEF